MFDRKPPVASDPDPIKHVVLLMLENHSFDQMLGCFQEIYPDLDGIDPNNLRFNIDDKGQKIFQRPTTEKQMLLDPGHDVPNVKVQLENGNSGFVKDFVTTYPNSSLDDRQNIMGYYPMGFLPALHPLAREFVICNRWHSSVPGPTWTNRFFALSGTSSGRVNTPVDICDKNFIADIFYQQQTNLFDRLDETGKTWLVCAGDFALSLALTHQREPHNLFNYRKMDSFFEHAKGPANKFPDFVFVEPKYMGTDQNDDHPPHNTMKTEKLIADVYNAIRSNPALWESTLLVITYDEHGGFYDHVEPPAAVPPDEHQEEYTFDQLGVRVPALLISPWVKKGVEHTLFDHTSLLKYLTEKWHLGPLGERTRRANSIACAFQFDQGMRQDCLTHIVLDSNALVPSNPEAEKWATNSNQKAIHVFADFMETTKNIQTTTTPPVSDTPTFKEKVGHLLVKFGMWLEKDAYRRKEQRIAHTIEIADKVTGLSAANVLPITIDHAEENSRYGRRARSNWGGA